MPELGDRKIPSFPMIRKHSSLQEYKKAKRFKSTLSVFKTRFPGDYTRKGYHLRKRPPLLINNSLIWSNSEDIYEVFQRFSPSSIIVIAAGNKFMYENLDHKQNKASKKFDAILVGSFSPKGFVSDFSNSGEEIHIMAPSDVWISSAKRNGEHSKFSGTSGAAPLVTGSLAGFEWLSGYHPTSKEAKVLLEKTAFPTLHSHEKPKINGVGLLNAYKLGEVGKRLKKKCKNKKSCFKKEILNEENYRFDLDKSLEKDLSKVFPSCSVAKEPTAVSLEEPECQTKRKIFKRLRKTVLLNPKDSKELLKVLSCIYKEDGFSQNAEALDKLALALDPQKVRANIRALAKKERKLSDETIRLMLGVGGFEEEFELFKNRKAIRIARGVGASAVPVLEKAFDTGDLGLQRQTMNSASRIGTPALPIIEKAFKTNDPFLEKEAVKAASLMGKKGFSSIGKAFDTLSHSAKIMAVERAGWNKKFGLPVLEKAIDTGNPELQRRTMYLAKFDRNTGFTHY